ncbi:aminotransferase class I/II-fold pyridoxal phosphate-dependent enzyme [Eubacteriaceae bacterium ES3]|nr:aminotransferase class I/II-fold pyridoxal phosphate-dependent enzyme [Eubacteriaceae bacterium ES3]
MISRRVRNCGESIKKNLLDKAQTIRNNGNKVFSFESDGFELPQKSGGLNDILANELSDNSEGVFQTDDLRLLLTEKLRVDQGLDYGSEQILIGQNGDMNFLMLMQVILNPGEEVLISKPHREHYPDLVKLAGGLPRLIETGVDNENKLSIRDLENAVSTKTKAVVINASMGICGGNYSISELLELADFFVRSKLIVVWDEMDNEFNYNSRQILNIASINQKIKNLSVLMLGHTIQMHSDSHSYLAANKTIINEIRKIGSYFNPSVFIDNYEIHINKKSTTNDIKELLKARRNFIIDQLSPCSNIDLVVPAGGYYIYIDISEVLKHKKNGNHSDYSIGFCDALLNRENTLVMPGEINGLKMIIRLSYLASEEDILTGCERLISFISKY